MSEKKAKSPGRIPISTKKGDKGMTGLLWGGRVPKDHFRPETYGLVEEAVATIGLARVAAKKELTGKTLLEIQKHLFIAGAELACKLENVGKLSKRIGPQHLEWLEDVQQKIYGDFEFPSQFIIPGASEIGARLDLARTVVRRAERNIVGLQRRAKIENEHILSYFNRLSDLLWMLERIEEGQGDSLE